MAGLHKFVPLRTLRVLRMGLPQTSRCSTLGTWGSRASRTPSTLQYLFCVAVPRLFCVAVPRGVAGFPDTIRWGPHPEDKDSFQYTFFVEVLTPEDKGRGVKDDALLHLSPTRLGPPGVVSSEDTVSHGVVSAKDEARTLDTTLDRHLRARRQLPLDCHHLVGRGGGRWLQDLISGVLISVDQGRLVKDVAILPVAIPHELKQPRSSWPLLG